MAKHTKPIPSGANEPVIKPTSDLFTAVLWSAPKNEPILVDFISAVLIDSGQQPIREATVLNPYSIKEFAIGRQLILDVRAQDEMNRWFNIEVQTASHTAFRERTALHWADMFASRLRTGNEFSQLQSVISIVLAAFPIFPQLRRIHTVFRITAEENPEVLLSDHFQMHYLRQGDLAKRKMAGLAELHRGLRDWLNFFTFGGTKTEEQMAQLVDNNPAVMAAYEEFKRFTSDAVMRDLEWRRRRFIEDQRLYVSAARTEGKAERDIEIARNMKAEGFDTVIIAKMTGLSSSEIERLD